MKTSQDIALFNELYTKYRDRFINFAYSYTADRMEAEDIVMESLMYYWENRNKINEGTNLPAYILTMIKHKALNYLRNRQSHLVVMNSIKEITQWNVSTQISSLEACNPEEIFSKEIKEKVKDAMKQMSPNTKKVFIMCRLHGKTYQEIAEELGISTKSVGYHLGKATDILKKYLKDYYSYVILFLPLIYK